MMAALQIGPMVLPVPMLLLFAAYGVGSWLGTRQAKKNHLELKAPLFLALVVGLLAARLSFVWQFHDAYLMHPQDIIDIRDGGWNLRAGWAAAWICALGLMLVRPVSRKYVLISLSSASAIWLVGTGLLSLDYAEKPSLPDMSLMSVSGRIVSLSEYKGKPMVVNLWASWCPPCQREMPVLHEAEAAHPEIQFLYLNQGESSEVAAQYLLKKKLPLQNVLLDNAGLVAKQFNQRALPTTLFFDQHGKLVDTRLGEVSHATLSQYIDKLLLATKGKP